MDLELERHGDAVVWAIHLGRCPGILVKVNVVSDPLPIVVLVARAHARFSNEVCLVLSVIDLELYHAASGVRMV